MTMELAELKECRAFLDEVIRKVNKGTYRNVGNKISMEKDETAGMIIYNFSFGGPASVKKEPIGFKPPITKEKENE